MAGINLLPARFPVAVTTGNDVTITLDVNDALGADYTWSGKTVVAPIVGHTTVTGFTVDTSTDGTLVLSLTDAQTTALGSDAGFEWSLSVTVGTATRTWLSGPLSVYRPGRPGATNTTTGTLTVAGAAGTAVTVSGLAVVATGVAFTPTGTVAATTVQAAIAEVSGDVTDHLADTADAHDASAVSVADAGGYYTGTNVETVLAELPGKFTPGITVADEFGGYANGARVAPRLGGPYVNFGGSVGVTAEPEVVSGILTCALAAAAGSYAQVDHGTPVSRVGGRFKFGAGSTTDNGSAVLIAWDADIGATWPTIPDSPCHLAITTIGAIFGVWSGGTFTQVKAWTFATELAQGSTVHTAEVLIDTANSTAYVFLPDGTLRTVTHATIGAITDANYACWETYRQATSDALAGFTALWSGDDLLAELPAAKWAAAQPVGTALVTKYAPATNQDKAVPASEATVDATNLIVSIVAPASGKILIELDGVLDMSGSTRVFWSVRSGATTYGTINVVSQQWDGAVHYTHLITGLTAGNTYDFVWRHWAIAAARATLKLDDPNGYQATMTATPIHT